MWRSICAVRLSASRNQRFTNALKEWERQAWRRCIILRDSLKSDWWRNNNTFLHSPASRLSQTREKIDSNLLVTGKIPMFAQNFFTFDYKRLKWLTGHPKSEHATPLITFNQTTMAQVALWEATWLQTAVVWFRPTAITLRQTSKGLQITIVCFMNTDRLLIFWNRLRSRRLVWTDCILIKFPYKTNLWCSGWTLNINC